eukprot:2808727-Rhodomonas_salina.3
MQGPWPRLGREEVDELVLDLLDVEPAVVLDAPHHNVPVSPRGRYHRSVYPHRPAQEHFVPHLRSCPKRILLGAFGPSAT